MELNEDTLSRLIQEVMSEYLGDQLRPSARVQDKSGVTRIDPTMVAVEPFPFPIPSPPGSR